jgi:hypothetical protein
MISIEKINTASKREVERFVQFPYHLYKQEPNWVPPLLIDQRMFLNRAKHPFYEHSDADFFVAMRDGEVVGRIAVLENRAYNNHRKKKTAQFYLFDAIEDIHVFKALFAKASTWAQSRGLTQIVGPKGFGPLDGYGVQVEGFEHRQLMTMMNYNFPYYPPLLEEVGFKKEVDFISCYLGADAYKLPDRVHSIAERVLARGNLAVKRFKNKRELVRWGPRIGKAYNQAFVNNWEYYPLSAREIDFVIENIMTIADPRLIKIITHNNEPVGFLFGFPDVSSALQQARGKLFPTGILHLLREVKRTNWIALNGAGILPEFQGRGGNALLYSEMEKTIREYDFEHADLTQVAESAEEMRADLINLGGKPYKNHRVYIKKL